MRHSVHPSAAVGARALALLLGAVVTGGASAAEPARAPPSTCPDAPKGGPGETVRALYAAYPWEGNGAVQNEPRPVLSRYFAPKLTDLFLADQACRDRYQGLCHITSAPLFAAQDGEITDLRFCTSKRGAEWIEVRFENFGKEQVIAFRLTKTPAGWRIADLVFDDEGSLVEALSRPM